MSEATKHTPDVLGLLDMLAAQAHSYEGCKPDHVATVNGWYGEARNSVRTLLAEVSALKARVERLEAAGDAMDNRIGDAVRHGFDLEHQNRVAASVMTWRAALKGGQS